jgi:hypothetical protein
VRLTVKKVDGTDDVFGNVMHTDVDAESFILTVTHGDENAKVRMKSYVSGAWSSFTVDVKAPAEYSTYPADAKVIS